MKIIQKICDTLNLHNWKIDNIATKAREDAGDRTVYKVFICTRCGMQKEIKYDRRYFFH